MRGSLGLTLVVFGTLVWFARWMGAEPVRDLDRYVVQAIAIIALFGLAMVIVRLLGRMLTAFVVLVTSGRGN